MSYTETKTLGVKYTDHHFRLYINGSVYSRNEVTLKDGTKVYVNYGYTDYAGDGINVPARDYKVVK